MKVLTKIIELKRRFEVKVFGDSQCSSQMGSLENFRGFSLLVPNEKEARMSVRKKGLGLEHLAHRLIEECECRELIVTLAQDGFIAYTRDHKDRIINQPFPALTVNPVDVAGAGDSLLAVMSTGMGCRESTLLTAAIACCMTGLAVENMGNRPIQAETLKRYVHQIHGR